LTIPVQRMDIKFYPDSKRIITRFFEFGDEERVKQTIRRLLAMDEASTNTVMQQVQKDFAARHRNINRVFMKHYGYIQKILAQQDFLPKALPDEKKLLIGAYFTKEFSIESAAFFNPSMVEAPDQSGLAVGEKRVIASFRATGEGHISSIVFRGGIIDRENNLSFEPPGQLLDLPEEVQIHTYTKDAFIEKLSEMDVDERLIGLVMDRLGNDFTYQELESSIGRILEREDLDPAQQIVIEEFIWLARSYYEITFSPSTAISERVIFPVSSAENNGIEDARFVRCKEDDGACNYYATYTAYNGITILPKLLETKDFCHFKVMPLYGEYAKNKGLALFPKKINGHYAMVSRVDGVNNYIMYSKDVHHWKDATIIQEPEYPWQFVQVGNCGSPIETERGWLLLTHGVGPMRTYSLGATLLDRSDPTIVLGQTREPLLVPNAQEREGYVPNVVYSCGAIVNQGELIIPYAMADYASLFAKVKLNDLFAGME
jgi:predicted GH43/DUF377 family glycosyl hydrolase